MSFYLMGNAGDHFEIKGKRKVDKTRVRKQLKRIWTASINVLLKKILFKPTMRQNENKKRL